MAPNQHLLGSAHMLASLRNKAWRAWEDMHGGTPSQQSLPDLHADAAATRGLGQWCQSWRMWHQAHASHLLYTSGPAHAVA